MEIFRVWPTRRKLCGFTLIEMLVAIAIVAIITAVALPSYQKSMQKSRRANAFTAVSMIQQSQERWRANNASFTTSLTDLRINQPDLYTISIGAPDADSAHPVPLNTGYIVTAEGTGSQAADMQCRKLSVRLIDGNLSYAGCYDCTTFDYQTTSACWAR